MESFAEARGLEIRSPERIGDAAITSGSEQLELARTRPSPSAPLSVFWRFVFWIAAICKPNVPFRIP